MAHEGCKRIPEAYLSCRKNILSCELLAIALDSSEHIH